MESARRQGVLIWILVEETLHIKEDRRTNFKIAGGLGITDSTLVHIYITMKTFIYWALGGVDGVQRFDVFMTKALHELGLDMKDNNIFSRFP
jgi:hypothetical protein